MGHIAQMNMGYLLHPHGDPRIAGFEDNSDRVNAVADRSKGFIWRLQGEGYDLPENDTGALFGRPEVALATLSTWKVIKISNTLFTRLFMVNLLIAERRFEHLNDPSYVIWPIENGYIPSLTEGKTKLLQLRSNGPSPEAYNFTTGENMSGYSVYWTSTLRSCWESFRRQH